MKILRFEITQCMIFFKTISNVHFWFSGASIAKFGCFAACFLLSTQHSLYSCLFAKCAICYYLPGSYLLVDPLIASQTSHATMAFHFSFFFTQIFQLHRQIQLIFHITHFRISFIIFALHLYHTKDHNV